MKIILHKLFPYAPYLNEYIGFEKDIPDNSTDEEALQASASLRLLAERSHKERYPEMYQSNANQYPNGERLEAKYKSFEPEQIPVIQRQFGLSGGSLEERIKAIIADIGSVTDLKVLESYRLIAKTSPEIQRAYDSQLSNIKSLQNQQ